jgi:hypothetical protein
LVSVPPRYLSITLFIVLGLACACGANRAVAPQGADVGPGRPEVRLRYIEGSTTKVEQLIGDVDNETKQPTYNQTLSRYSIRGTDLGHSFEHNGRVYFLFGDTLGQFGGDAVGVSASSDPDEPLMLDFLTNGNGRYATVEPPGVSMEGDEVPVAGISLGGEMYVAVKTNHTQFRLTDRTLLTR